MKQKKARKRFIAISLLTLMIALGYTIFSNLGEAQETQTQYKEIKMDTRPLYQQLEELRKEEPKVSKILDNFDKYPSEIIQLLIKNPESIDFALAYLDPNKSVDNSLTISNKDTVPKLYQWDVRWGYAKYGDGYLAFTGCAPTVLSMAAVYFLHNTMYTPYYVSQIAERNGYYIANQGTSWSLISASKELFNLDTSVLSLDKNVIDKSLNEGSLVVCSMLPGDFTTTGHFILLVGIDAQGNYIIRDPNSPRNTAKSWSYETLAKQISNLWSISK